MDKYSPLAKLFLILSVISVSDHASAQSPEAAADTMHVVTLSEMTVTAPRVIHKADMDVYIPSKDAVGASQNGMALLRNLMIPTLSVNEIMGTVRTGSENVEIRINGRQASVEQLTMLSPSSVKRIEWIDNPGLRYGDAVAVVNIVISNPTAGGSFMVQGMQACDEPWGNGYVNLKLNRGRSQWELGLFGRYTDKIGSYREYSETFTLPDGSSVTRTETPVRGYLSMSNMNPELTYSYMKPEKTTVWVAFSFNKDWPTERYSEGKMESTVNSEPLTLREYEKSSGVRPRLNVYIEQRLPRRQVLALEASGSIFSGNSLHSYSEQSLADNDFISDVRTLISDSKQTLRVEGYHVKNWSGSSLTTGIQYNLSHSRSTRENGHRYHQQRDQIYWFCEYFRKVGAVNLTGGLGVQYTGLSMSDSKKRQSTWSMRPRLSAAYRLNRTSQFRLNFSTWQTTPSMSQTDSEPQQIDGFQYQIGNPDLHAYSTYRISLQYNLSLNRLNAKIEGRCTRKPGAIAPWLEWDGDRLITLFENSVGQTDWQVSLSPQVELLPKAVTVSGSLRYVHSVSSGTGYRHKLNDWSGNVSLAGMYRNFSLIASFDRNPAALTGEIINTGEKTSDISLCYRINGLQAAVGMFMPFNSYSQSSASLNRYNMNHNVLRSRNFDKMPFIRLSYNIAWGKQKKGIRKIINTEDEIEQSKAAGR